MADDVGRVVRSRVGVVAAVLAAVVLTSCSTVTRATDGGASEQAQVRAESALRAAELTRSWATPEERAARMDAESDVLAFDGDAEHSTYMIRTTGEGRDGFGSVHLVTACLHVEFDAWSGTLSGAGSCPADAEPLHPVAPTVVTLPPSTVEGLTSALDEVVAATSADSDSAAIEQAVRASTAGADVAVAVDGSVGVAYSAGRDCVLGRITHDRVVEVWVPPRVVVAPGELGCTGATAANGLATHSPH